MNEIKFANKDELLKSSSTVEGGSCHCQSGSCGGGRML